MKIAGKQLADTLRTESTPFDIIYADRTVGDLNGAIRFTALNNTGSTIGAYKAVYINGVSGNTPTIALADADTASMPAFGLTVAQVTTGNEVDVITFGNIKGVDTSLLSVGDVLYVSTTAGEYTTTPPTGSSAKLQNIGMVVKSDSNGIIKVGGAGRSAATPNLDGGHFFVGNASNQSIQSTYQLPISIGTNGQVLTSDGTNVTFQDASGSGSSDFTEISANVSSTDFTATNYYVSEKVSTQYSIDLPNRFEGDDISVFYNKRIIVENHGSSTVRIMIRDNSSNRIYVNNTLITQTVSSGGQLHEYYDIPSNRHFRLSVFEHATVTYWYLEDFVRESFSTLSDVTLTTLSDKEVLTWDDTNGYWKNIPNPNFTVSSVGSADFTAVNGYFYYVNTASSTTTKVTLPARTYASETDKIKLFNHGDGLLEIYEADATDAIHPNESGNDGSGTGASNKIINSRCMIEIVGIPNSYTWEYAISPTLEFDRTDIDTTGHFFTYDSTTDSMKSAPFRFSSTAGTNGQVLTSNGQGVVSFQDVSGGSAPTVTTLNSASNTLSAVSGNEEVYLCAYAGNMTIELQSASSAGEGFKYTFKRTNLSSYDVDISTNSSSSDTIDDGSTSTVSLGDSYSAITLVSDGTSAWYLI